MNFKFFKATLNFSYLFIILFLLFQTYVYSGTDKTSGIIYQLEKEIAVCKVNCHSFGNYDCQNKNEREIVSLNVSKVKQLFIKGRGLAEASTCYSHGRISAEFESNDGKVSKQGEGVIQCKSSGKFTISLDFETVQSGELTIYLRVSDWCTALTKLKVIAVNE